MATLDDLYAPDFPHGSPAGFDRGCRGAACPNHGDAELLTCREAKEAKRSDYALRNHPDAEPMKRTMPAAAAPKPAPPTTVVAPPSPVPIPVAPADEPAVDEKPAAQLQGHGTTAAYQRGCHTDLECPNYKIPGEITCAEARRQYTREWAAKRRARQAAETVAPDSTTEPAPDPGTQPVEQPPAEELVTLPAGGTPALDDVGPLDIRTCRECGCTDNDCIGCIERTGAPCWWVGDDLCSACEPAAAEQSATPSEAPSAAAPDPDVVADLERRLQEAREDLHRTQEANGTLVDELATTSAALQQERDGRAVLALPVVTGGEAPTAIASVQPTGPEQLELFVAHTDQGTRLQLTVPAGAAAELQIVNGAVSMKVGGR